MLSIPDVWKSPPGGLYTDGKGYAWFRCLVKVPADWQGQKIELFSEPIDDAREAYVNGVKVGGAGAFPPDYRSGLGGPDRFGVREELVTSGASTTWHDLVLYLIARCAGSTIAQEVARLFALQWHQDGLTPYIIFEGRTDHGDGEIRSAQQWLANHFSVANPVEEMIGRSKLAERTFKRRFVAATSLTPIAYVQRLRIEDAKRRLERTDASVDEISWRVGYEDPAFFRRLFKRTTGLTPGAYRRRFRIPDFTRGQHPRRLLEGRGTR